MSKTFDELVSKVSEFEMKKVSIAVAQDSAVLEAVESGRIPMDTVNQAVYRVLHWKDALGLLF